MNEAGFESLDMSSIGDPFAALDAWPKMRYMAKLIKLFSAIEHRAQGEILVVTARKQV